MKYEDFEYRENTNNTELKAIRRKIITIDSHADIFKYIAIAIAIIGFIAGIVCGYVFSVNEIRDVGKYISRYEVEESFNVALMVITWIGTAAFSFGTWIVYCILYSMDNILMELKRTNEYHRHNKEKE